jgi:hypothetical protein
LKGKELDLGRQGGIWHAVACNFTTTPSSAVEEKIMKTLLRCLFLTLLLPLAAQARPAEEDARIEQLLSGLRALQGAKFVRSGKQYDGKAAEEHLRMKLEKAGERVQTAEQFVDGVASKSYLTGKPYQIQFADGRVVTAGEYLHGLLKKMKTRPKK